MESKNPAWTCFGCMVGRIKTLKLCLDVYMAFHSNAISEATA